MIFISCRLRREGIHRILGELFFLTIGDDSSTRVWEEPWIPDHNPGFKPTVGPPDGNAVMVEDLIDPISGRRDVERLITNFIPMNIENI